MKLQNSLTLCVLSLALLAGSCGRTNRIVEADARGTAIGATTLADQVTTPPAGVPVESVALIAGQSTVVGSVVLWIEDGQLAVRYSVSAPWTISVTHVAVAASMDGIPLNPAGNPLVGHFPYAQSHPPGVTAYTYAINLEEAGLESESVLELAAHAEVVQVAAGGEVVRREGAWGEGESFAGAIRTGPGGKGRGGNWAMHFRVDMNRLKGLLLWNKLGSQWEVEHSEVGPNGIIVGQLAYPAGRYGSGFRPMPRTGDHNIPDNYVEFHGLQLPPTGCIEFWYHPNWTDWNVGHIVHVFSYGNPQLPGYIISMHYNDWQDFELLGMYDAQGSSAAVGRYFRPTTMPEWTTAQPFHMAVTWDGTEPIVTDRLRFYMNGNPVPTSTGNGNPTFVNWDPAAILRVATRWAQGDWNRHNWESDDATIDNLKIWSYPKQDFSDRFAE